MLVDSTTVSAVVGLVVVAITAWNAYQAAITKAEIAGARSELLERLARDKEEMFDRMTRDKEELRLWVNGSFMRASEVLARLAALEARM